MAILLPPPMQEEELLKNSVMAEPRNILQKLSDAMFGRGMSEQMTNAFTGGVGVIKAGDALARQRVSAAKEFLPIRIWEFLNNIPQVIRARTVFDSPTHGIRRMAKEPMIERSGLTTPPRIPGGTIFTDVMDQPAESGLKYAGSPERIMAHELTHAAEIAAKRPKLSGFPGLAETTPPHPVIDIPPWELLARKVSGPEPEVTNIFSALDEMTKSFGRSPMEIKRARSAMKATSAE